MFTEEEMTEQELEQATAPEAPEEMVEETKPQPTVEELAQLVQHLQSQLDEVKNAPKNQVPGKPRNVFYERLGAMKTHGKVPQQQADLAKILSEGMETGTKYPESEVFAMLNKRRDEFPSLRNSRQDVTYLFRYYRGLKPQGNHAGFVSRDFLRVS